jgi:hypothetical protein
MLGFDWRSYHQTFGREKRTLSDFQSSVRNAPIWISYSQGNIVSAYHESQDLSEWIGAPLEEFFNKFSSEEILSIEHSELNQWLKSSLQQNHYYAQLGVIKESALPFLKKAPKNNKISKELKWEIYKKNQNAIKYLDQVHFLFEAIETWWKKILPQHFLLFIRVRTEESVPQDLFLEFQNGEWIGCEVPDLSSLSVEQLQDTVLVSKVLKENYKVPSLIIETNEVSWKELILSPDPWRVLFKKIGAREIVFFHSRFKWWVLIGLRAFLGI